MINPLLAHLPLSEFEFRQRKYGSFGVVARELGGIPSGKIHSALS